MVTAEAYLASMEAAGIRRGPQLCTHGSSTAAGTSEAASWKPPAAADSSSRPGSRPDVLTAVLEAYDELCRQTGEPDTVVAVRSSATAEDAGDTSFAGMHETFTNVRGADEVCDRIVACWASLFGDRACAYRSLQRRRRRAADRGGRPADGARPVARACCSRSTRPPTTDRDLVIEAAFGQGEVVVSGSVEPDTYLVAREPLAVLEARIGHKSHGIFRGADGADRASTLDQTEADATGAERR